MATVSISLNDSLYKNLADVYVLTALTQNAHWNITGPDFFQLHGAFGDQYDALFDFVDEIAERIRQRDGFVKVSFAEFESVAMMPTLSAPFSARDAVSALLKGHEQAIARWIVTRDLANKYNDLETQDLAIKILEYHEKTRWMLKSYLG